MSFEIQFEGKVYQVELTDHAKLRMLERSISVLLLKHILDTGTRAVKPQNANAYWVYANIPNRVDNMICVSLVLESDSLIVKTVLINWSPR